MQFNSIQFAGFFIVVLSGYGILPGFLKRIWLLSASYYFYACWNVKYSLLMLFSTLITYLSGIVIGKMKEKGGMHNKEKAVLFLCLFSNLLILFFFKYYNFFSENISRLGIALPALNLILPVGISFYTLQAIGYTIDVYRGTVEPEINFINYALFVSFFPQLVAGPIERSGNIINQLKNLERLKYNHVISGLLLMLYGLVLKVVIANRLAILVDNVFDNYTIFGSSTLVIRAVFFSFQLYCDFHSYSSIAIGAARTMGVKLMDNFNAPFLATSAVDFWDRWHISLSTWLRDYLYIPLGGNRKGKTRRWINILIVMLVSGLWHGASWHFVFWGRFNGIWVVLSHMSKEVKERIFHTTDLSKTNMLVRNIFRLKTFLLATTGFIFFRAQTISDAFKYISRILNFVPVIAEEIVTTGLTFKEFSLSIYLIIRVIVIELITQKTGKLTEIFENEKWTPVRFVLFIAGLFVLAVFGVYGRGADVSGFIYFQF